MPKKNVARTNRRGLYGHQGGNRCAYCGRAAEVDDHVWPVTADPACAPTGTLVVVPSCGECNGIAGNRTFKTIDAKRAYIQGHLSRKYRKVLATPDWTQEELDELGPSLYSSVTAALAAKQSIIERINHDG